MGSGKTTVGRLLAQGQPTYQFVDTDALIEAQTGSTIPQIFRELGVSAFRAMERNLCEQITTWEHTIVSTGGGMVVDPENRVLLGQAGVLICLDAAPETLYRRLRHTAADRPLLQTADPMTAIRDLLWSRRESYAAIPLHIQTDDLTTDQIAVQVWDMYHSM